MSNYVVSDTNLAAVANAIRAKGGTSAQLEFPADFVGAIAAIPTGGGGASNVVVGTFKGTSSGAAIDFDIDYQGSGYPIAIAIFADNSAFTGRYSIPFYLLKKSVIDTAPNYSGTGDTDKALGVNSYKNSTNAQSEAGNTILSSSPAVLYNDVAATNGSANCCKFRNSKKLSLFFNSPGSNYGFNPNRDYHYIILYSS